MAFIDELNSAQREAVLYNAGPHLVVAGAGSGKTRVLTYKVAYLLSEGVQPSSVLALTFTNKAAREMKERISTLVGEQVARYVWMGTFHSICTRILRKEHKPSVSRRTSPSTTQRTRSRCSSRLSKTWARTRKSTNPATCWALSATQRTA